MLCEKEHLQTTLPALRFLQETDRKTGSNYYHTLRTYLRNQQNQTLTAKELFISRSGLQHRLRDIQELLSFDLKKREYQLVLELSFYLSEQEQSENENP